MAKSPSHRLGQLVGDLLEAAIQPALADFCEKHQFYLDRRGPRPARPGLKVSWTDKHGNAHDLDFVIEQNGSSDSLGEPIGFIEVAWRRYTKHSRNKAQEIQGAILPLVETYVRSSPFQGVVLGGVFTDGAMIQLRSLGFSVLHFSYDMIIAAFQRNDLDVVFDERTPAKNLQIKVDRVEERLRTGHGLGSVARTLHELGKEDVQRFLDEMGRKLLRRVVEVGVMKLFGERFVFPSIHDAATALDEIQSIATSAAPRGFEVFVRYSNGDEVSGRFVDIRGARGFLAHTSFR